MTLQPAPDEEAPSPVWQSGPFLRFWGGHVTSSFGDQISSLALPYLAVTVLQATSIEAGALTAALWLPNLLALAIGTWVDAVRRRQRLLVMANVLQCVAIAAVPVVFVTGGLTIVVLYVAAIALGMGGVLYNSAYPSFFVRLVRRDQYLTANSLLSTTLGVSSVTGPAIGGLLINAITAPFALLVDSGSFLVAAAAIASTRTRTRTRTRPSSSATIEPYRRRLALGIAYLRQQPVLRASLLASATMNLAAIAIQALLVLFATRQLGLDARQIGFALGVGATGGIVGAITTAPLTRRIGVGRAIAAGVALNTLPFILLPIAAVTALDGIVALGAAEFISAWAIMLFDINNNALRATVTRDDMRARASGAYSTLNYGIRPVGALLAGWIATSAGPGAVIAGAAVLGTLGVLWIGASPIAALRGLDEAAGD